MAKELKLPELGENIESADVLNVLVKVGDKIEIDQSVIEIETDKATIEVPSNFTGIITGLKVKPGDKVKPGQTILTVDESGKSAENTKESVTTEEKIPEEKAQPKGKQEKTTADKPAGEKEIIEMKLPELGENIEAADILSVLVKKGDNVEKDQSILEIETDKATIEVPATVGGKVIDVLIKEGTKAKVGQPILKIESSDSTYQKDKKTEPVKEFAKPEPTEEEVRQKGEVKSFLPGEIDNQPPITGGAAPAAPSVRKLARELGVNINKVTGSGPAGRISMDDVKAYVKKLNLESASVSGVGIKQESLPDFSKFGSITREPMNKIRIVTAEHLGYAWTTIPHVTQFDKADITLLEQARKAYNPKVEKAGGKLTITSILIKVIAAGLKAFPKFNSSIDMEKKEIIYKKYYNVGIAVDTDHGLIVPVVKNVDKKNLTELSVEMGQLAEKARARKIGPDELQGACFTITNLGGIGGTSFTPIVNSPEVAILGVSRGSFEQVYIDKTFKPRLMLPLSLSYDHRIIDGADAARFLRWVSEALEQPMKILLEE
ncbi:MAG TPA: dihydrolipoyllysine-residue acetyltransferase [Ignavibacteriaceae bacterium]|nr:dihydrolipoyllysine-residue acetyltransferase [Ignavibacteriaceae bacterium]